MTAPKETGYRFLEDYEKDGRYSNGRSEFWCESDNEWTASGGTPNKALTYRVSTFIHNPEGLTDQQIDTTKYRYLKKDELDGRFKGKAEFWLAASGRWELSENPISTDITYRISLEYDSVADHAVNLDNPENIPAYRIDYANYRLVTEAEKKNGKWARKCECWDTCDHKWVVSYCADIKGVTYRVSLAVVAAEEEKEIPKDDNPEQLTAECIDLKNYRLLTREEKISGKWANKAEYWASAWFTSHIANRVHHTYRLHRSYGEASAKPEFPEMPEEFKHRHFTLSEIDAVCAFFGCVDIPKLLNHWNCKKVQGVDAYAYHPPEVVKELTIQEKLPEFFTIDQLADALGSTYKASDMYAKGQVIPVPGSAEALMFAPKKEEHVVRSSFDLFKEAMTPMFSIDDAYAFGLSEREFNNFLQEKLIVKMTGLEFYKFNN